MARSGYYRPAPAAVRAGGVHQGEGAFESGFSRDAGCAEKFRFSLDSRLQDLSLEVQQIERRD